ncbi:MAG TPA: hypothetical protein VGN97_05335 [Mesorhizobium sp.]|nr:hypothetical protein [Mesorhizobium sp.]
MSEPVRLSIATTRVTIFWRTRSGGRAEMTFEAEGWQKLNIAGIEGLCRRAGYPGHNGAWWRYLLGDVKAWWTGWPA